MNYNHLRYFSVLAQLENYTLAAARLEISQPSLSNAIHNLEDELGGVKLFQKVGRNIRLTEEGRYYRDKVDSALRELNMASATLRDGKTSAPVVIRIGVVSGSLKGVAARELAAYAAQNERIRFRLTEGSADELMDLVRQEKLDMAMVDSTNRDRSLHFRKLSQQDLCVALPVDHPLADSPCLLPQQISELPQVAFHSDRESSFSLWVRGMAAEEHTVCTVNTSQAALEVVGAGLGVCILPASCQDSRQDVVFVPLKGWHQALYMCILYDKWLEPPVWAFVEQLVRVLRSKA